MADRTDREIADDAIDALRHIIATSEKSETQTRRLRWIAERAKCGIDGTTAWQKVDFPRKARSVEHRERRLNHLRDQNSTLRVMVDELIEYLQSRKLPDAEQTHWENFLALNPEFPKLQDERQKCLTPSV